MTRLYSPRKPSVIEQKAYRDTWGYGLDSYLQWFYETALLLHELLHEAGTLYVHLDQHVSHYVKNILDEIFGLEYFQNEIIWQKIRSSKAQTLGFGSVHDAIFAYRKTSEAYFKKLYTPLADERIEQHYKLVEPETGRRYMLDNFTQGGAGEPRKFGNRLIPPPQGKHWIWSQERIDTAMKERRLVFTSDKMVRVKRYLDESRGNPMEDIWIDIPPINAMGTRAGRIPHAEAISSSRTDS
jgi:adenine-specific DNA-methyltransferase